MSVIRGGFGTVMLCCLTLLGGSRVQAAAAGRHHWSDHSLGLSLTYSAGWSLVVEHGAALKLRAADRKGEFEIFRTPRRLTITAFNHGGNGVLLRSWLYHAPAGDSADLPAIEAALSPAGT
jgi:hypothetical protein